MAVKVPFIRLHERLIVRLGYGGSRLYITGDIPNTLHHMQSYIFLYKISSDKLSKFCRNL
jgi:hypothetical protein